MDWNNSTDFQDTYGATNNWSTTLSAPLDDSETIVSLSSVTSLPSKGYISIDQEHIYYDYIDGLNLGDATHPVTRGADDSTAASHGNGAAIEQRINAAVFNALMLAVKKRKSYNLEPTTVAIDSTSEQNLTSFVSRAQMNQLYVVPYSDVDYFNIGLYCQDTFLERDLIYKTTDLYPVRTTVDASSSGTTLNVLSVEGYAVNDIICVGNPFSGTGEFAVIESLATGVITTYDTLQNTYTDEDVSLAFVDKNSFYYEDLDWTSEIHIKIINADTSNTLDIKLNIIAEVSDEAA